MYLFPLFNFFQKRTKIVNILIINYEFPPLGGGGGVFTKNLAKEIARKHSVDILTSRFMELKRKEETEGFMVYRVSVAGRKSLYTATLSSLLSFPLSAIPKGINLLSKKRYDIINTHFAVPTGPVGAVLSSLFKIPNVLSIHGGDIYDPSKRLSPHRLGMLRWCVRNVINGATKVVAQSTNTKKNAENIYHARKDIEIIPLGIPMMNFVPTARQDLSMQTERIYIISVGRLVKRKQYDTLIKALNIVRKNGNDVGLILVGEGPERNYLEKLSFELGLSEYISFLGAISDEKKLQYLSKSDIYTLSSLHEGFGIVLLESMLCGLPIIATDIGGQTDIITNEKNGILIPTENPKALADAIIKLVKDNTLRKKMVEFNKEDVKKYEISRIAERYLTLFKEILDRRS